MSVHSITPTLGVTRKFPLSSAASTNGIALRREEEGDEAKDERVEHDRLGQCEAEPLDRGDLIAHLRLTGHRLDDLAEDEADAHARADGAEAGADAQRDRLAGLAAVLLRISGLSEGGDLVDDGQVHGVVSLLVLLGDCAAEVDRGK